MRPPRGVVVTTAFFVLSGVVEVILSLVAPSRPLDLGLVWTVVGRGLMSLILAYGLWHRVALCRSMAMVYCLAMVVTYGAAIAVAYAWPPAQFPRAVVLDSLLQVPSCVLLFIYLRSREAAAVFVRPLF